MDQNAARGGRGLVIPKASPHPVHRASVFTLAPADWMAILLCVFIVLFPKGGVKIGAVPLTWGYLLMGLAALAAFPLSLSGGSVLRAPRLVLVAVAAALPFQATLLYAMSANGVKDWAFAISNITNFALLPGVMLIVFKPWNTRINWAVLLIVVRACVFAAAVYGIVLFCVRIITGHFIEIPYLTVNAGDYGFIETEKYINRGGIFKLISTYNNGNVYGVATIILMPLFDCLESRRWRRAILRIALVLTLSRTVWLALLLDQVFSLCAGMWDNFRHFPIVRPRRTLKPLFYMLPIIGLLFIGLKVMSRGFNFLFDPTFGGRLEQFHAFASFSILPALPVADMTEVVYASALKSFGMVGFLSLVLLLGSPLLIAILDERLLRNPLRIAALKGLMLYAAIAWADGAISFIPVMAFYWFAMLILIYGEDIRYLN